MNDSIIGEVMCRTCFRIWFGRGLKFAHEHHCALCVVIDRKLECEHCRTVYDAANPPF